MSVKNQSVVSNSEPTARQSCQITMKNRKILIPELTPDQQDDFLNDLEREKQRLWHEGGSVGAGGMAGAVVSVAAAGIKGLIILYDNYAYPNDLKAYNSELKKFNEYLKHNSSPSDAAQTIALHSEYSSSPIVYVNRGEYDQRILKEMTAQAPTPPNPKHDAAWEEGFATTFLMSLAFLAVGLAKIMRANAIDAKTDVIRKRFKESTAGSAAFIA